MSVQRLRDGIHENLIRLARPVGVSFEFFPPKDEAMEKTLWSSIERLAPLKPRFISVTYGADGSTRTRTHGIVTRVMHETNLVAAPHLTCVGSTREEILDIARGYWNDGIRHIVALRGDAPQGTTQYQPHADGFAYASDLVAGLKSVADFEISVASYPETHPEAATATADLDNLKAKLDAGATRSITQSFCETETFLRFRDRCAQAGITAPLVPGLLPIISLPQLLRFASRTSMAVPDWLRNRLEGLDNDPDTRRMIAAAVAIEQVQQLAAEGVDEFHFYTLNRAELTYAICHALGVRPEPQRAAVA